MSLSTFKYKARNKQGKIINGSISANNKIEAKNKIRKMSYFPISVSLKSANNANESFDKRNYIWGKIIYKDEQGKLHFQIGSNKPDSKTIILFTKQLQTMLSSGVPLLQSLEILAKSHGMYEFQQIVKQILNDVENGISLSNAVEDHREIFGDLYIALLEAGEASGNLDIILNQLAHYMEKTEKIKAQVKGALTYPIAVISIAILIVVFLLLFVVPTFAQQFEDAGRQLPQLTQFVVNLSDFFINSWHLVFLSLVAIVWSFRKWKSTKKGRDIFDHYSLYIPKIGDILQKVAISRFCSTISIMLSSGVNLLDALNISSTSSGNSRIESFILQVRKQIEDGSKFSQPLSQYGLIPDMVISMVEVGESTGALDVMLEKVASYYEEEVNQSVQSMLSLIEPFMIVVIGAIVGFIVIAMYLPVFEMAQNSY